MVRFLALAACAWLATGGVHAATPGERLTGVRWAQRPSGRDIARFYPAAAAILHVSGESKLKCSVKADGSLENCVALDAAPASLGFDTAVLRLAGKFKMSETTDSGEPVAGGEVVIPVRFTLPPSGAGQEPPRPRTSAGLELGRQLVASLQPEQQLARLIERNIQEALADAPTDSAGVEAASALRRALQHDTPSYREDIASIYGAVLTEPELREALAFAVTPAGDLLRTTAGREALDDDVLSDATDQALIELIRLQCRQKTTCPPEPLIMPAPAQARSPQSLVLARQLVGADPLALMLRSNVAQLSAALLKSYPGMSTESPQIAETAKLIAADLANERLAVGLTHMFSDAQLSEGLRFYRTSGYVRKSLDIERYVVGATYLRQAQMIEDARAEFCRERSCTVPQPNSANSPPSTRTP